MKKKNTKKTKKELNEPNPAGEEAVDWELENLL